MGATPSRPSPRSRTALAAVLGVTLAFAGTAEATVLYKSIAANGVIQFSDTPPENARVIEERAISDPPRPGETIASGPGLVDAFENPLQTVADGTENDAVLARANAQVDLAEHALALARRSLWRQLEGLRLGEGQRNRTDAERVAFYQRNLASARANLMEVLRRRMQ